MGVPKRRTPKAKQSNRRSHRGLQVPQLVRDRATRRGWRINHTAGAERDRKGRPLEDQIS